VPSLVPRVYRHKINFVSAEQLEGWNQAPFCPCFSWSACYLQTMKRSLSLLVGAGLLLAGCGKKESAQKPAGTNQAGTNQPSTNQASGSLLTAPVDYVGALGQAKRASEKVVDTAALNQTIQLFYAQEDRFPTNLNELVTMRYLPSLPKPPYGMKFDYDARLGQLKVVKAQ